MDFHPSSNVDSSWNCGDRRQIGPHSRLLDNYNHGLVGPVSAVPRAAIVGPAVAAIPA
ncbi:hypothetical protein MM1S1540310_2977 [Mycobacteroides abscessus subsp. bolletii 1S-154-0310]|uniref:Uncharacterized protein n=1 Tax=Mycobacteroides abscessus MAB_091912_2446 TaxID=1335414 RepID=A0A829MK19_9MYCO|nr:hypothetical protein MM1S1510930_3419 [Mycobacteroides abscessus subsp. bolletii 1S-151-0930]EIU68408.1 hypothetical protein MM1S1520914_3625 [Mycobacteroides abscessus subsp. bolletii 1S-152-0914]EIU73660.1 hypothetical protein MM1S1530915_2969 [Mycobacteroides abscessus subsp. bolletii 1S-153-0915]EIU77723.1 hypothetical protein MM2B0626_3341 [Mycobacteroides abscessus subsp. bolletii 2B-0626]EIU81089.1 hypothetical protein MM1S1540310_2977 [Mycobacteroides abscessus subsp. bolletii 1S-154